MQDLGFLVRAAEPHWPLLPVRPDGLGRLLERLSAAQAEFLRETGFKAASSGVCVSPGAEGLAGAVFGLGEDRSPMLFGGLAFRLPEGRPWRLAPADFDANAALLGYCLGAYRYGAFKAGKRSPARLIAPEGSETGLTAAVSTWMVRDLVNAPANVLGPAELADVAVSLAKRFGVTGSCAGATRWSRRIRPSPRSEGLGPCAGGRLVSLDLAQGGRGCAADLALRQGRLF